MVRRRTAAVLLVALGIPLRHANAAPLSPADHALLDRGELVQHEITEDSDSAHFVGGVVYTVMNAPPERIMRALMTPSVYQTMFPLTTEARLLRGEPPAMWVRLTHGNMIGSASYTCEIHQESPELVRFWLDPRDDHDVDNMWGYFRVQPLGTNRSLVTYAAAVDLGDGFLRMFFEERIRQRALRAPRNLRTYVENQ